MYIITKCVAKISENFVAFLRKLQNKWMCMEAKEAFGHSNRGEGEFVFYMSNLQDSCHVDYVGAVCALRRLGEKPRRSGKPPLCKGRWHGEAVTEGLSPSDFHHAKIGDVGATIGRPKALLMKGELSRRSRD